MFFSSKYSQNLLEQRHVWVTRDTQNNLRFRKYKLLFERKENVTVKNGGIDRSKITRRIIFGNCSNHSMNGTRGCGVLLFETAKKNNFDVCDPPGSFVQKAFSAVSNSGTVGGTIRRK